jgi:thiosulfate/3-mercaptopyruvate sulfurtransferase
MHTHTDNDTDTDTDTASLIDAATLRERLASGQPTVLLDCSFDLADPAAGRRGWQSGHLPGSIHVHLDDDLSGAKTGSNGRHPLPERRAFAATVGAWGISPGVRVVTFDGQGSPYAARAWWLLRWLGHRSVAVLDGGIAAWTAAGGALTTDVAAAAPQPPYPVLADGMPTVDADILLAGLGRWWLLDTRAGERFRGEVEPLDPVAGHIPGARHRFFKDNLQPGGRFKPAEVLRAEFDAAAPPSGARVVHQCGSGVTACHNLLAMEHAGLGVTALFPGSWSEWCADPARPVARG